MVTSQHPLVVLKNEMSRHGQGLFVSRQTNVTEAKDGTYAAPERSGWTKFAMSRSVQTRLLTVGQYFGVTVSHPVVTISAATVCNVALEA